MDQASSSSLVVLCLLIPIIIGCIIYTNKTDGLIYGAIATTISICIPYIFIIKPETNPDNIGSDTVIPYAVSCFILFIIITTIIVFILQH